MCALSLHLTLLVAGSWCFVLFSSSSFLKCIEIIYDD